MKSKLLAGAAALLLPAFFFSCKNSGNVKPSGLVQNGLKYLKVDPEKRLEKIAEWNSPVLWPLALLIFGIAALAACGRYVLERRSEARAVELQKESAS